MDDQDQDKCFTITCFKNRAPKIKEVAMGYKKGSTTMEGITETMRHKILGACMDLNVATWIIRHAIQTVPTSTYLTIHPTQIKFNKIQYADKWIVDGGATSHFTGHVTEFIEHHRIPPDRCSLVC